MKILELKILYLNLSTQWMEDQKYLRRELANQKRGNTKDPDRSTNKKIKYKVNYKKRTGHVKMLTCVIRVQGKRRERMATLEEILA